MTETIKKVEPHVVLAENAAKIWDWLRERGGLVVWRSINLSNPGASWTGPYLGPDGKPSTKPSWQAANEPERKITDAAEVLVSEVKEVKRFRVAIRQSGNGLMLKCTDGATRRIRAAVAKAREQHGKAAFHGFDYETQEAVIYVDDKLTPISEWIAKHGASQEKENPQDGCQGTNQ